MQTSRGFNTVSHHQEGVHQREAMTTATNMPVPSSHAAPRLLPSVGRCYQRGALTIAIGCLLVGCSQQQGAEPVVSEPAVAVANTTKQRAQERPGPGDDISTDAMSNTAVPENEAATAKPNAGSAAPSGSAPPYAEALARFNRAAGLMEMYEYAKAARGFMEVQKLAPDWAAARFNLGLAYLNMIGESDPEKRLGPTREMIDAATTVFEALLEEDPGNLRAHFCLGMLQAYLGEPEQSLAHFQQVYDKDPDDRYVAFCYAKGVYKLGRYEESVPILERIVQRDPGFVSGVHFLLQAYSRTKRRDEAKKLMDRFRKLNADELAVGTFVVDDKYGMAGKYYFMIGADGLPLPPPEATSPQCIRFDPQLGKLKCVTTAWQCSAGTVAMPALAVADVDGDQDLDVLLSGLDARGSARVLLNDATGKFAFAPGPALADAVASACFGDVDNDGDVDLWLGRGGADQLLLNDGKGHFHIAPNDAAAQTGIGGPAALTPVARLADIDSDGDLDLLAMRRQSGGIPARGAAHAAPSSVWFNNTDGTFVDNAETIGLQFAETPMAAVVYDDFDNDFDLDLMMFPVQGDPVAWVNYRVGQYGLIASGETGLDVSDVWSCTSGDPNKDGNRDLLIFTRTGVRLYLNDGHCRFHEDTGFSGKHGKLKGTGGQFADFDNDGDLDIVIADAERMDGTRGPTLLVNDWPNASFVDAGQLDGGFLLAAIETKGDASCVAADFTGDGRCDLLLAAAGEAPLLVKNTTPGGNWIELDLAGNRPQDRKARSNNSAIGARVEVKAGRLFQQYVVGGSSGPVASQPLRIHAGLGEHTKIDWLRIIWPDAILQGEVEVAANRVLAIDEISRKPSSCPYLFAWTGTRFEFVADFGGVGGLGYYVGHGQYAAPDSTEYLPIPRLVARDGNYELQSLTPLEEITYFDEVKLLAIDHPKGTEVHPHEMMAISVAPPEFELFLIRNRIHALHATDQEGHDVTRQLRNTDREYAGATKLDPRFTGLAEDHHVDLDFGNQLRDLSRDARPILFLHGWVEYGYSSTNYAASQANARAKAPTISVLRDGKWVDLCREIGYPAGLNHLMTVDLTGKLVAGDRFVRVASNMELYWDEIYLGVDDAAARRVVHEVAPRVADLHFRGYPRAYSPDGRHPPLYDYDNLDHNVGWKLMTGDYTRFGDVRELLADADDCFVIMGHGEEITLRFAVADFPPIPADCVRSFILKTDSYCKDMDLYTAYPNTVEPLPFHAMSGYPYGADEAYPDTDKTRAYRKQWNTRSIGTASGSAGTR